MQIKKKMQPRCLWLKTSQKNISIFNTFAVRQVRFRLKPSTVNILFVCSRNKWRSRTAETVFKNNQHHNVKSAGTENDARIKVTEKLINWANLVFVMEKRHKQRLREKFETLIDDKEIVILDIEDDYKYMDAELIDILKTSVAPYIDC